MMNLRSLFLFKITARVISLPVAYTIGGRGILEDLFGTPIIYEEKICVKRQQPTYLAFR